MLGPFRTLLKMVLIDLDLQGHLGSKRSKSTQNGLVRTITRHVFELGSPNMHQMCILCPCITLLKMVLIDLDFQGHLGVKTVKIGPKRACLHDNSLGLGAQVTKYAPNVYLRTLQNPIENVVD